MTFINTSNLAGGQYVKYLLDLFAEHSIDSQPCRDQSYDNGSNMSGMQAIIKEQNLTGYISCSAYSLNLVGQKINILHF